MSLVKKILLVLLVLGLIVLIIATWGSIASIIFTSGLIMVVPIYLFNRYVNTDEISDFIDDENA